MSKVSRSVAISAPVEAVFAYYARPEHIAKTFPEDIGMKVIPLRVTEGFGIGTIFRISGEFGGKHLEWDMETVAYQPNQTIQVKAINGPFKKNVITVLFEQAQPGKKETKLTFEADYDLGYGLIGKSIDKLRIKKEVEMGIERSCASVKRFIDAGKSPNQVEAELSIPLN
ncbi:MAG: SRPBCC family protein [Nitrososphaerales archaeon]